MSGGNKKAIDDIMDLFDLGGTESDESNDYDSTAGGDSLAKPSFDELVSGLGDSLGDAAGIPALPVKLAEETEVKSEQPKVEAKVEPKPEPKPEPKIEPKVELAKPIETPVKSTEKPIIEKKETAPMTQSNEEMIKSVMSVSVDEDEVNINVADIFSSVQSTKKESQAEGGNSKERGEKAAAEGSASDSEQGLLNSVNESSEPVEAKVESTPEKTEAKAPEPSQREPIPFDLSTENTSRETPKETPSAGATQKPKVKLVTGNRINWLLTPPSDKYINFYLEKSETLETLLGENLDELNFTKIKDDLRGASVNMNYDGRDDEIIHRLMREIQQWKERVAQIAFDVNTQYYKWKRFVEMLRGQLARVDQEKNAERRDGVVFQHMRDFELYFSELENVHSHVIVVMKNLDSAWETWNRKVTIILEEKKIKEPVRYRQTVNESVVEKEQVTQNVVNVPSATIKQEKSDTQNEPKAKSMFDESMLGSFDGIQDSTVEVPQQKKGSRIMDW